MLPRNKGNYKARPIEWSAGESDKGTPQFTMKFDLYEWFDGADWQPVDLEIIGYFYPVSKDRKRVNETACEQLEKALGWNRTTGFTGLSETDWSQVDVQVYVDFEEYQGENKIKVKWLNPIDHTPGSGVEKADPQAIRSLDAQFGSLFRATAKQPAAAPAPTPGKSNGATAPKASELEIARRAAWAGFKSDNSHMSEAEQRQHFVAARELYFNRKPQELITAQEWRQFLRDHFVKPEQAAPISDKEEFADADIPF